MSDDRTSPERIEAQIHETEQELQEDLDALKDKLTPEHIVDEVQTEVAHRAEEAKDEALDRAREAKDEAMRRAEGVKDKTLDRVRQVSDTVQHEVRSVAERVPIRNLLVSLGVGAALVVGVVLMQQSRDRDRANRRVSRDPYYEPNYERTTRDRRGVVGPRWEG